jgi:undecaprenyl-diphosphatase
MRSSPPRVSEQSIAPRSPDRDRSRRPAAVGIALYAVLVALAAGLTALVATRAAPVPGIDSAVALALNRYEWRHATQVRVWKVLTTIGGPATWQVLAGVGAILLAVRRQLSQALFLLLAVLGGVQISRLVKVVIGRHRPVVPHRVATASGSSYPSGHAMASAVAVGAILVVGWAAIPRRARPAAVAVGALIAVAVGFSRLILGVHFLSDVIGAWLIAAGWLIGLLLIARMIGHPVGAAGDDQNQ